MQSASTLRHRQARLAALVGILLASAPVQAEWALFGRNADLRLYVEQNFQRNGDLAQTIQLMDFTTARWTDGGIVISSIRLHVEYDCRQARSRILLSEAFSEQMAGGRRVGEERVPEPPWQPVDSGSSADRIRQLACQPK